MDISSEDKTKYPLNSLCKRWVEKLRLSREHKKALFTDDADEAMKFFICGKELRDLMWKKHETQRGLTGDDEESMPAPRFQICVGKVAELVELFGPTLYHRNPDIVVDPKTLEIPDELLFPLIDPMTVQQAQMAAQQAGQQFDMKSLIPPDPEENDNKLTAKLMEFYLNYIQRENDKKTHSRRAIDEALIKGMGVCWTEVFDMYPGGPQMIGSFYDTVDNLLIDPDAETIEEAWWIARRRLQPYWEVADKFGIDAEYLKEKYGTHESLNSISEDMQSPHNDKKRQTGKTNDLIEYWEIYSKMGFGMRLKNMPDEEDLTKEQQAVNDTLRKFGDNVFIAIAERVPFPLNFKTDHLHELMTEPDRETLDQMHEEKLNDVSWPVPFWAAGMWPFTQIAFHEVPNSAWPMSHIKPGMGYLKFLNWVISFMVNKIRVSARSVAATFEAVGDEIKERLFSGKDFEILSLKANLGAGSDINKLVSFLTMPEVNPDVWKIVESVFDLFNKATGLDEIMYGAKGGFRSAAEVNAKESHASARTDDMANKVEDALSLVARKEAMAARWLLDEKSVAPVLGKRGASLWEQFVADKDIEAVAREFNFRVEAGSARKPNRDTQQQVITQIIQNVPPLLQEAANPQMFPVVKFILQKLGEANGWELPDELIQEPIPQPNPMQQKIEAEIEGKKQELQMKMQGQQAELQMRGQEHQVELQAIQAKAQAEQAKAGMEMQTDQQKAALEMQLEQQKMGLEREKMQQQLGMEREKANQEVTLSRMDALSNIAQRQQEMKLGAAEGVMGLQMEHQKHQQGMKHAEMTAKAKAQQAKTKPKGGEK